MRIHRYTILPQQSKIRLPRGATIIRVGWSKMHDSASLWAVVNPISPDHEYTAAVLPTGENIPNSYLEYAGSFETPEGLVFHLFTDKELLP